MSAVQFFLPHLTATVAGIAQPGAQFEFLLTGTTTPQTVYSDSGLTIPRTNPVVCNGVGALPTTYLDNTKTYRLRIYDKNGALLTGGDIDPYIPGTVPDASVLQPYVDACEEAAVDTAADAATTLAVLSSLSVISNAIAHAANRTVLAALNTSLGPAYLFEAGCEGMFVWDSSNLSAKVTADVNKGIYVPSSLFSPPEVSPGTLGAWVRKTNGSVNPEWWGIVRGSNSGLNGIANSLAFQRMLTCLKSRTVINAVYYISLEKIRFPSVDTYEFAGDDDIIDCSVEIEGAGPAYSSFGTELKFPAGKSGLRFQYFNTSGLSGSRSPDGQVSSFSTLRSLRLTGAFATTEGEYHGVVIKSHGVHLDNVWIKLFEGDGVYSAVAVPNGNANNCQITGGGIVQNRRALFTDASDTNAWNVSGCDMSNNRWAGAYDSSFLGNSYFACSFSSNGLVTACDGITIPVTMCTSGGNRYGVIFGQEAGASLNAPSGTTADNTWWFYVRAGGVFAGIPAWFSGMTCRPGGPVITDSANATNEFFGCYYESDQSLGQIVAPSKVHGGLLATGIWSGSTGILFQATASPPAAIFRPAVGAKSNNLTVTLGEKSASITTALSIVDTVLAPLTYRLQFNGNDLSFMYQNSAPLAAFTITCPSTIRQCGTGATVLHSLLSDKLRVGLNDAARLITALAAAPASGVYAKGDFILNNAYTGVTALGMIGWMSNSVGGFTTDPIYSGQNKVGIGYITGAGGTITQATSKATGVTLNKICGQITLNAAALAAGANVTFTVTDSQIAATDVITLNLASGNATDGTYDYRIGAVAAGSFKITLENISAGSLSEALVFNYAAIKAVAA